MNKLENLIKFKIGYYDSMINILSTEDPDKNQRNIFILETKKRALKQVLEDYHIDPFTLMCWTDKEYQKSLAEYTRQEMENRFGYDESY